MMTMTTYAKKIGVSRQRVAKYIRSGRISPAALFKKGKRVLINPEVADADLQATLEPSQRIKANVSESEQRQVITDAGLDPDNPDFQKARAMNEFYKAALKKLEYEKQQGMLLDAKQVEKEAFDLGRQVRDGILAVPNRLCDQLASEPDRNKVLALLRDELTQVLEKLSS